MEEIAALFRAAAVSTCVAIVTIGCVRAPADLSSAPGGVASPFPDRSAGSIAPARAAKAISEPSPFVWSVGFNETLIDGYIKFAQAQPPDPNSNIPARNISATSPILYDLASNRHVGAFREILPLADIEPTYLSQANYPYIEDVIASYSALNVDLIVSLGLPLPSWMSDTGYSCVLPPDTASWNLLKNSISESAGRLMLYLWNSSRISRAWLQTHFYLEGFNEFDNLLSTDCKTLAYATPLRAADLQNGIQWSLDSSGIQVQTLMPSIVGANEGQLYPAATTAGQAMGFFIRDYYNRYFGTGLPNVHYYSGQTTAAGYAADVANGIAQISSALPAQYQGSLVLGETAGPTAAADCSSGLPVSERTQLLASLASSATIQANVRLLTFWRLMDLPTGYKTGCEAHYGAMDSDGSSYYSSAIELFGFLGGATGATSIGIATQPASVAPGASAPAAPSSSGPTAAGSRPGYDVVAVDASGNVANIQTTFTILDSYQASCDPGAPLSGACGAAVNRYCLANGWGGGGYGPVEYNGDSVAVVCFSAAAESLILTPFAEAQAVQPACTPSTPTGAGCNSAANRLCVSKGYAAGFGPVEYDQNNLYISCMSGSYTDYLVGSFTELMTYHPGCSSAAVSLSGSCNAAINRDCAARGYVGGVGVLEYDGNNASFACFR